MLSGGLAGRAAELDIYPVMVKLSPARIRDSVTLSNNAETPTVIEARIFRWTQTATGDQLVETNEAITAPPVFTLQPRARQVVRIGLRREPESKDELYYRLILSEVLGGTGEVGTIAVALRLSLPVFYTPPDVKAEARWSVSPMAGGKIRVALRNAGNAHLKVSEVTVALPSDPEMPLAVSKGFKYVLPGVTRAWTFSLGGIVPGAPLLLRARNRKETLEHGFEMPSR